MGVGGALERKGRVDREREPAAREVVDHPRPTLGKLRVVAHVVEQRRGDQGPAAEHGARRERRDHPARLAEQDERAAQARDIGIDGLVCSGEEAALLRPIVGAGMALVTPGIRPAGAAPGDQKRVMTPAAAIAAGADRLVMGRPIVAAPDPRAAAEAIVAEIARAANQG